MLHDTISVPFRPGLLSQTTARSLAVAARMLAMATAAVAIAFHQAQHRWPVLDPTPQLRIHALAEAVNRPPAAAPTLEWGLFSAAALLLALSVVLTALMALTPSCLSPRPGR